MTVMVDGAVSKTLSNNYIALAKFLRENTRGGKVDAHVELFNTAALSRKSVKVDDDGHPFHWIMSSLDLDRDKERIDVNGWKLHSYKTSPVVLWSHDRSIPAIGYAENVKAETVLEGDIFFNSRDIDEFGWGIGQRVAYGSLKCGSVGFLVLEVEFIDHAKCPEEEADLIYRKQELLEFSICNVPANPFALYTGGKSKALPGKKVNEESFHIYNFLRGRKYE